MNPVAREELHRVHWEVKLNPSFLLKYFLNIYQRDSNYYLFKRVLNSVLRLILLNFL